MYQLFIFFMITDPKTTVSTVRGRIIVAAAVAVAEAGVRLAGDFHVPALNALYPAPPILALAIVGPVANLIDLSRAARSSPFYPSPFWRGETQPDHRAPSPEERGTGGEDYRELWTGGGAEACRCYAPPRFMRPAPAWRSIPMWRTCPSDQETAPLHIHRAKAAVPHPGEQQAVTGIVAPEDRRYAVQVPTDRRSGRPSPSKSPTSTERIGANCASAGSGRRVNEPFPLFKATELANRRASRTVAWASSAAGTMSSTWAAPKSA